MDHYLLHLTSEFCTLEGTSPARHECIVDQRDNFALSKFLGGATPAFSHRGSGSELH